MHAAKRPNSTKIKSAKMFLKAFREILYPRNIPVIRYFPSSKYTQQIYTYCCFASRKTVVKPSKVTSAVWGPFDQYIITGHEDGSISQFDIINVRDCTETCNCVLCFCHYRMVNWSTQSRSKKVSFLMFNSPMITPCSLLLAKTQQLRYLPCILHYAQTYCFSIAVVRF